MAVLTPVHIGNKKPSTGWAQGAGPYEVVRMAYLRMMVRGV